jgi:hypothetical protein
MFLESLNALMRPATEKRQGTKSRSEVHRWCGGLYGELTTAVGLERMHNLDVTARLLLNGDLRFRMGVSLGDGEGRRHCPYPVVKQKEPGSSVWVELPGPIGHTQRRQRGSTRKCRCAQRPNTNYKSVTIELLRSNGTAGRREAAESDTCNCLARLGRSAQSRCRHRNLAQVTCVPAG